MTALAFTFYLLALLPAVRAGINATDANNYFISPSSNTGLNPVWILGDQQVISWKTTLGVFNISIWQENLVRHTAASRGNIYSKIHESDSITEFTWTVQLYGFDLHDSNVFFFWINADTPQGFISTYFNITDPTDTPANTPTATRAVSSSTITSEPTSSVASSSSESPLPDAPQPVPSSDIPVTGKIALGVGIGIGIPVLAALGALVWLRARRPRTLDGKAGNYVVESGPSTQQSVTFYPKPLTEVPATGRARMYSELS